MTTSGAMRSEARAFVALTTANARYWTSVLPFVHRGLHRWTDRARRIPDRGLRELALEKLAEERFNTEVAATLATLAPRRYRARVIDAIVSLQVMYDYLDGVSELPVADQLGTSRSLFTAFLTPFEASEPDRLDYYADHADRDDDGYLEDLVAACRTALSGLPRLEAVAGIAREAALRCGESQSRTHAIPALGVGQLSEWAAPAAAGTGLAWWEFTAGATASILCVHALIAAAADVRTTVAEARRLDTAYLFIAAVSTLLDSLIDREEDVAAGSHSFVGYYETDGEMIERIAAVTARAASEGERIRNGAHHRMTAAGVAAYYLSAPATKRAPGSAVKARVVHELRPLIVPVLGIFRFWRLAKAAVAWR